MKAHELAQLLLQGPDLEIFIQGDGDYIKDPIGVEVRKLTDKTEIIFVEADDDDRDVSQFDEDDEDEE